MSLNSEISPPQFASFSLKNAHYRDYLSHLSGFCSFACDFISLHSVTRGCINNFDRMGLMRRIDSTKRLIYFKMLVYILLHVAVPSFLFTIGTVTGLIVTFLSFLRLTSFFQAFHISLEHGLHEGHALITPRLLVGLLGLRGLTCCCLKGLTIAVIATAVQGVVGLEGSAMGLASLAKLLTATILRDLTSRAPRRLVLWVTFGLGWGCTALSFRLEVSTFLLNHDLLDSL